MFYCLYLQIGHTVICQFPLLLHIMNIGGDRKSDEWVIPVWGTLLSFLHGWRAQQFTPLLNDPFSRFPLRQDQSHARSTRHKLDEVLKERLQQTNDIYPYIKYKHWKVGYNNIANLEFRVHSSATFPLGK